jgi:RHS repeat-associated protein
MRERRWRLVSPSCCAYQTNGTATGPFGRGTTHASHVVMLAEANRRTVQLGDGRRFVLTLQPDGSYRNLTDGAVQGAVLTSPAGVPTLRWKDGSRWVFGTTLSGAFGVVNLGLTQQIDRTGNTLTNTWSGTRLTAIAGPDGRQLTLDYDGSNRITRVTDPIGRSVLYAYDGQGNLATVTDPEGGTTRYEYDSNNRMTRITDAKGITYLQNFYGPSGRVLRQLQADGSEYRFRYQLTGATSSGAGCTNLTGNIVTVTLPFVACPTVDSWENLQAGYTITGGTVTGTTVVDPRGHATTTRFNPRGYPVSTIDALGQTSTTTLTAANQPASSTDSLGRATKFEYDPAGNVTKIVDPANQATMFEYEPTFNRVKKITDALTQVTEFTYDPANGNLLTVKDPRNQVTTIAYNTFGQPTSVQGPIATDPPTTFIYDTNGNLITTTDPLGNQTQRVYDAVSRLTTLTDPKGLQTQFRYDGLNRVTEIADARQGITRFTYDPNGNLLSVQDAKGQATSYTYNSMDRLATRKDALNRQESYVYDLAGNLSQFTDRKNQQTTFIYDALNRRTTATYPDSVTTFTYDSVGRLTKASDTATGAGTIDFAYDTLDRLIQEVTGQGSVAYQYDVLGRRTQMVANGQQPVTYGYDSTSRLTQVAQGSLAVGLGYDNANRRTSLTYPNGTSTSYTYDVASRLTTINHIGPSGIIEALTYQYDAAGNRTSLTRNNGTASLLPAAVASATYDAANEQKAFAGTTLTYDNNGNLTSDGTNTYVWDARNRLVAMSGGATATFSYDPLGRRASKTINSVASQFLYDGYDIAAEIGGGAVGANYLRSLNIDEPFIRQSSTSNEHYHTDALGSSLALSNISGASATTYTYEPFGKTTVTGTSSNSLQYTGRENDGTGVYYYRDRYYSSILGRFLQEDREGIYGGDVNLYGYVWGNPLRWNDPRGREGAVPNPSIQITPGPDGKSLMLEFDVHAPAGTSVTIDVSSKIVLENGGAFTNNPFVPVSGGHQTGTTTQQNLATFQVNVAGTPGYIQILTPGLSTRPTILTGPVAPGSALVPCKYNCNVDKSYGYFPPKTPPGSGSGSGVSNLLPYQGPSKGLAQGPKLGGRK